MHRHKGEEEMGGEGGGGGMGGGRGGGGGSEEGGKREKACFLSTLPLSLLLFWQLTPSNGGLAVREICSCLLYRGSSFQSAAVSPAWAVINDGH